jgi:hypothetical protein
MFHLEVLFLEILCLAVEEWVSCIWNLTAKLYLQPSLLKLEYYIYITDFFIEMVI